MKRIASFFLALALAFSLTACTVPVEKADDGKIQIVATLFPYYDFARAIAGDRADVTLLLSPGREAHSFEPTPLDAVTISESDVFLYNGGEGEYWVDSMLGAAGENIAVIARMMDYVDALDEEYVEGMQGADGHDHEHEHGSHDDHDDHDHEDGVCPCCGGHHDDDDDDDHDHEHHHHHDHDDHDEDEHEHHHHDHEDGETCSCGHHHHHHHGHDADEVFVSVGVEPANRYEQDEVKAMLDKLSDEEEYGTVLRAKGVLQNAAGDWFQFDYVPGESQFRPGTPDYTGRLCVIGAHIDEKALRELFKA